jgi:hypothetical protein
MALLAQLDAGSSAWMVAAAMVPTAFGIAATGAPLTTLMMAAVPPARAGMGSAMNNASRELGGAFGVAVLGSVLTTRYGSGVATAIEGLPASSRVEADSGLAGAIEVAKGLPGDAGAALVETARNGFVDGFAQAGLASAGLAVAVAVAALVLLPRESGAAGDRGRQLVRQRRRVLGRQSARVPAADVGGAVGPALPQRRVVTLTPGQDAAGDEGALRDLDQVGAVAGHHDLVDAVDGQVDGDE